MTDNPIPKLPNAEWFVWCQDEYEEPYYSTTEGYIEEQMLEYGQACATAERERIAELARSLPGLFGSFADCYDFAERVLRGHNSPHERAP